MSCCFSLFTFFLVQKIVLSHLFLFSFLGYDLTLFVDRIANIANRNPYLIHFLNQVEIEDIQITKKIEHEASKIMPNVVCYAMVLDRLTIAMKKDVRILEICDQLWGDIFLRKNHRRKRFSTWDCPVTDQVLIRNQNFPSICRKMGLYTFFGILVVF